MSNLNQFLSGVHSRSPTSLVRNQAVAGWTKIGAINSTALNCGATSMLSGALTANTLATLLSLTGAGVVNFLAFADTDGGVATRTMRAQVVIDGVTVWDYTSASLVSPTSGEGVLIIGGVYAEEQIPFNSSFVVKVASSLTETDQQTLYYKYRLV